MQFIYIKNLDDISITTLYTTLKFICVDKNLYIDFTSVLPTNSAVQWTQLSGSPITILNSTTIAPTIVFPPGYNTYNNNIVLKLSSVDNLEVYVNIEIDTKILSSLSPSNYSLQNRSFLPPEVIPNSLEPAYLGNILQDYNLVYYNNSTFNASYSYVNGPPITKVEWYENINGVYTLISNSTIFNHTISRHVKAKFFYNLNGRQETYSTSILNDSSFRNPRTLFTSNIKPGLSVKGGSNNVSRLNYLLFIAITNYSAIETPIAIYSMVINSNVIEASRSNYEFNILDTVYNEQDSQTIGTTCNNSLVSSITRNSYQLNTSGISIG